jgi:segregation and condensation protein A
MLIQKDEITWQSLLLDLIKSEQMDPWNIDITMLTKKYLETIKEMKEANFFISGKILLACALLLKIKSNKLVNEEISHFDSQLFRQEETYEELEELFDQAPSPESEKPRLTIKTPMPRKRKVTLNDLMKALNKALEVEKRRNIRRELLNTVNVKMPEKKIDITELINNVYAKIVDFFKTSKTERLTFTKLVSSDKKEDKVYTFIPLLHLDNQEKVNISQDETFGEINIEVFQKSKDL